MLAGSDLGYAAGEELDETAPDTLPFEQCRMDLTGDRELDPEALPERAGRGSGMLA